MTRRWVGLLVRTTIPLLGKDCLETICLHIVGIILLVEKMMAVSSGILLSEPLLAALWEG